MNDISTTVLSCTGLVKNFGRGEATVQVLNGLDLELKSGSSVAIVGASGSGKSTLLHLLAGLDQATAGQVQLGSTQLSLLDEEQMRVLRNRALGFVYQFHHLLGEFTTEENVAMPLLIRRERYSRAIHVAREVLSKVGLENRLHHKPGELSGGERQRAAVARAIVGRPTFVLADEPTGNLDRQTAEGVQSLLLELNRETGAGLVLATHDLELAHRMQAVFKLEGGILSPVAVPARGPTEP